MRHLDAIVIGAGFGGLYMLKKLRDEQKLDVLLFDKASGIGGTWYWNRYPGALSDTEAYLYCYSWDRDLLDEWDYPTRYITQPEILKYLNSVVQRHSLMSHIRLDTEVTHAQFDERSGLWEIVTADGAEYTARYLVTALGLLTATNIPAIKGVESFEGRAVHTSRWPDDLTLSGKRVGVIGTGSTGNQLITAIAPQVEHLTVFQRTAQYSVPAGNRTVDEGYRQQHRSNYDAIWEQVRNSAIGFGFDESTTPTMSVSPEERQAVFQKAWDEGGGLRFMFQTFADIATDERANQEAQEFIKRKIREIVKDKAVAEKLCPDELYARRPLCDSGYYEAFNRDNVSLVDVRENAIVEVTPRGVMTSDGVEHALDILIFATGFDAVDGSYKAMDIRGRDGLRLKDNWREGAESYLGMTIPQYPNLFMVMGPNGPFSNVPPAIEMQVEWISKLIADTDAAQARSVEPTAAAQSAWTALCTEIASYTLFDKAGSWIFGANIPGKPNVVSFFLGGLAAYRQQLSDIEARGYAGFLFDGAEQVAAQ